MISGSHIDPTDLSQASPALFLTRWCTHFCAPVFVFLAGTGAFLYLARGKSIMDVSRFLWTRGLWLILLEFTLVRFGWAFRFQTPVLVGQVIWALGWSMILLAGLVYLPTVAVACFGIAMITLHNLLDGLSAEQFGPLAWLWGILHGGYKFQAGAGLEFLPVYPLVPWVGVMAAGYGFGPLLLLDFKLRRRILAWLGLGLIAAFILLRASNFYGDPRPWSPQNNLLFSCFSFVNCTKYPPSLLYLLMTLGPAILLLAAVGPVTQSAGPKPEAPFLPGRIVPPPEQPQKGSSASPLLLTTSTTVSAASPEQVRVAAKVRSAERPGSNAWPPSIPALLARPFIIFGRVPMFYYLLHVPLIHLLAAVVSYPQAGIALGSFYFTHPAAADYGHGLGVVYGVWITTVLLLFPLCAWFAKVKQARRYAWLSYL
jgi:uncharacterized membrane protein